jgi:hypothetical protein
VPDLVVEREFYKKSLREFFLVAVSKNPARPWLKYFLKSFMLHETRRLHHAEKKWPALRENFLESRATRGS